MKEIAKRSLYPKILDISDYPVSDELRALPVSVREHVKLLYRFLYGDPPNEIRLIEPEGQAIVIDSGNDSSVYLLESDHEQNPYHEKNPRVLKVYKEKESMEVMKEKIEKYYDIISQAADSIDEIDLHHILEIGGKEFKVSYQIIKPIPNIESDKETEKYSIIRDQLVGAFHPYIPGENLKIYEYRNAYIRKIEPEKLSNQDYPVLFEDESTNSLVTMEISYRFYCELHKNLQEVSDLINSSLQTKNIWITPENVKATINNQKKQLLSK